MKLSRTIQGSHQVRILVSADELLVEHPSPVETQQEDPAPALMGECIVAPRESSNTSEIRCGVSNVVYRNEYECVNSINPSYIQNIYAMTSEELGSGVTGSVRVIIDRYPLLLVLMLVKRTSALL